MTALELLRPYTTHSAQQRGYEYVESVEIVEGTTLSVSADVTGTQLYEVEIRVDGQHLRVFCTCPYFADRGSGCKHLWATAVVAHERGWLKNLPAGLQVSVDIDDLEDHPLAAPSRHVPVYPNTLSPRPTPPPPPPAWVVTLAAVTPPQHAVGTPWPDSELLYVLAPAAKAVTELPLEIERRDRKRNGDWSKPQPARLALDAIEHLPDEHDRWALSLLYGSSAYPRSAGSHSYALAPYPFGLVYLRTQMINLLLPRLCATGRVWLRHASANTVPRTKSHDEALSWDDGEPWRFKLVITRQERTATGDAAGYHVDAVLVRGDRQESLHRFALITDGIVVLDNIASRFDPAGAFSWAAQLRTRGAFVVPVKSSATLVDSLARSPVDAIELPEELQWDERVVAPRFHVSIGKPDDFRGNCPVTPAVEYENNRAALDGTLGLLSGEGRVMYRRDPAAERDALATLKRHGVAGLDSTLAELNYRRYSDFQQGPHIAAKKVVGLVHALVADGWHVEADGVRYRTMETPRLRISSGIDWFEIEAGEVDAAVDLSDLVKAIASGRRTVTLGDGTIGMLPEAWLARVAPLLALGETDGARVRFRPSQVALIDALLAAQPAVDWDEGFARARDALRRFEGVHAEDAPPTFQGELREYQRESLGWMRFLRDFGFGGCLADDMGLGKTVMVLAMLEARRLDTSRDHRPSLIVLPRSLLFNWTSEAARFAPGLRVLDFAHADRHSALAAIAEADLVLTTYGTLRRDVAALKGFPFDYVVLDEAQAIKNAGTATAKAVRLLGADHRLALTGTPVENHLGELQSLFDFLNPGLLGRGRLLDMHKQSGGDDGREQIARLANGLRPFFLRRTKEQVAPELPLRTDETLYCELEGEQRRVYQELRDHYRRVLLKKIDRDGLAKSRFMILEALLRLRQAACHTQLLPGRRGGTGSAGGTGFAEGTGSAGGTASRGDRFAGGPAPGSGGDLDQASAKFDLLLPRLTELIAEGRKALVFSQFTSLLALLRARLDGGGVVYEYLDGDTRDRAAVVARFQSDAACPLFLISLKAGGVGLNLTAAEYVFLLDPWWNPAVEMQAIDRTHRIGQTKPVFAYRLVARETVEERILELQSHKRALADAILDAGTGGLRGLKREDLEQLLA